MKLKQSKFELTNSLIILISGFLFSVKSEAQKTIINDSIFSKFLNEKRNIEILVPPEYGSISENKYNVIYLLDGELHFDDFSYIYNFARREELLPPLILVSIQNSFSAKVSNRERDFLPVKIPGNEIAGGADNFINFLKDELIPYIDNKFPTSGDNSIFGHSLGGLFSFYLMLKEPGLFSNYYCSDPAFSWNNRYIFLMAPGTLKNKTDLNAMVWINGVEDTYKNVGIRGMDSVLMDSAPPELRWKTSIYPNETHMSVRFKGIYDGLKYTYYGYNSKKLVEFHPNNGSLLEGKPAPIFLNGSFPDVYYTIDGSEPDTTCERAPQLIELNGPAELRVSWIGENKKYFTTSKGNFEISKVWPALKNVSNIKSGGLHFSYYEGNWETLPDFKKLHAINEGITDSTFNLKDLPARENFGCVFEGYMKIETEGYYMFALNSSDGSKLIINGHEIINNDGLHGNHWFKSYLVPLQKGFYPVRLEYFLNKGNPDLNLIYLLPDSRETRSLTFQMMYH
ncbi:MAG TPA: alpha/beta hydrolase-fold protein [Bacteroidales bacterium]|nr:alpha/beta hydrolase-fold protein [Bacteroidales bacterium]